LCYGKPVRDEAFVVFFHAMFSFNLDRWLAVAGLLVGIISTFLAYAFYKRSIEKAKPVYAIDPLRARIVDNKASVRTRLEVLHEGKLVTNHNITSATIYFCNAGRAPIMFENVKRPYVIQVIGQAEVLDCRIARVKRDICALHLNEVADEPMNTRALIFDFLEEGDGCIVQVIYSGDPNAKIVISGSAVGAEEPRLTSTPVASRAFALRFSEVIVLGLVTLVSLSGSTYLGSQAVILAILVLISSVVFIPTAWKFLRRNDPLADLVEINSRIVM
jgi:hypothetical protein